MKNSLVLGLGLGLIFPIIAFLLMRFTHLQEQIFADKPTAFYVIAASINLIGCWVSYKKENDKLGNGLVLATFVGMILLVFTKNISVL